MISVWVISTCIPGENRPTIPNVFASKAAALKAFDEYMREEWAYNGGGEPYPGAEDAHEIMSSNHDWGQWEITEHKIEVQACELEK